MFFKTIASKFDVQTICHAELVSASGSEPFLVLLRGQILKQVQDDHLLWAIVICYIEEKRRLQRVGSGARDWFY